jgi:hypothetical protein
MNGTKIRTLARRVAQRINEAADEIAQALFPKASPHLFRSPYETISINREK